MRFRAERPMTSALEWDCAVFVAICTHPSGILTFAGGIPSFSFFARNTAAGILNPLTEPFALLRQEIKKKKITAILP